MFTVYPLYLHETTRCLGDWLGSRGNFNQLCWFTKQTSFARDSNPRTEMVRSGKREWERGEKQRTLIKGARGDRRRRQNTHVRDTLFVGGGVDRTRGIRSSLPTLCPQCSGKRTAGCNCHIDSFIFFIYEKSRHFCSGTYKREFARSGRVSRPSLSIAIATETCRLLLLTIGE